MAKTKAKLVYLGGGSSSFSVLEGMKRYFSITAIVPVTDSGGSSGDLRRQYKVLPPGDIRQCMVALACDPRVKELLSYRFAQGFLDGHNLGNLLLTSRLLEQGASAKTISELLAILGIAGKILPVSFSLAELAVKLADGRIIKGESVIDEAEYRRPGSIRKVWIEPRISASPEALREISSAKVIMFSPGDLYTSLLPCLLPRGIKTAIAKSRASKIYVQSLMTKYGQTDGFAMLDYVKTLEYYLGKNCLNYVLYNNKRMPRAILTKYAKAKEYPVKVDCPKQYSGKINFVGADLLDSKLVKINSADRLKRSLIRHDPAKIAAVVNKLIKPQ